MTYTPSGNVEDPQVAAELMQIARAIADLNARIYPKIYAAPEKPQDGMVVFADGTTWDPGSGEGLYRYDASGPTWVSLEASGSAITVSSIDSEASTDGWVITSDGAGGAAWEAVPAGGGEINDLTAAVVWTNIPIANVPTGVTGSTVALGNHAHAGVYEPVDATILRDADIGVSVQAFDADLAVWATVTSTPNSRSLIEAADYAAMRALLDLQAGTDFYSIAAADAAFQPLDTDLTAIAALAKTNGNFIVGNGSAWVAESGATVRTSLGLGTGDSPQFTAVQIGHASDTTLSRVSAGKIEVEARSVFTHEAASYNSGRIHFSTSAPTGGDGSDGDIWFEFTT